VIEAVVKHMAGEEVSKEILIPTTLYTKADAEKDSSLR
jgi:ABC-type sugar transport system substrate-binding protein